MCQLSERRSYIFTLHELLVIAALGALGGVTSSAVSMLGASVRAISPPGGMQTLAGIHVLWLVAAIGVVPKPGVATAVGLLKGAVELLSGNPRMLFVLAYASLAGLTVDSVWLGLGRRAGRGTYMLAGGLGAASNVLVLAVSASLPGQSVVRGALWILAGVAFVSGVFLAGLPGWWLVQMAHRAGVAGTGAPAATARAPEPVSAPSHAVSSDHDMIRFEGFGWQFGGAAAAALRDICVTIQRGEFVIIAGPSGSGKSTLAHALCGLLIGRQAGVARGRVAVGGLDVATTPSHQIAELVGLVQQNPDAHFAALTVRDEIAFGMENRCWPREEIFHASDEAMTLLGITHLRERDLATLSGGEKQRVAVASLIAGRPAALVLDEPTASLDPEASRALFAALADLCQRTKLTVVIIEHKLMQLWPLRPRLIRLEGGRVVADVPASAAGAKLPGWEGAVPAVSRAPFFTRPATPASDPLVEMSDVTVKADGCTILDRVSLRVERGEVVAVLGPNGGGKTTLLHGLLGLVEPAGGAIRVCGGPVSAGSVSRLARHVGLVFQNADHQLVADTVWREALFAPRYLKLDHAPVEQEARRLLDAAGVYARRDDHPYRLSWGEKRRLNLVSAVLHHPSLLLLDEPFAGQDWENVVFLLDAVRSVLGEDDGARHGIGACLMVTHDPCIVWRSCTRVLFVERGRIIVDAPVPEAFARLRELGHDAYVSDGPSRCVST